MRPGGNSALDATRKGIGMNRFEPAAHLRVLLEGRNGSLSQALGRAAVLGSFALAGCSTGGGGTGGTTATPQAPAGPTTPTVATPAADNTTFGALLNNVRMANGAGTVAFDGRLATAAQRHADDMRDNAFFDHTGSDGTTVGDRVTAAGYTWATVGENIAVVQQSETEVMTDWTNSPGHHANNINPAFEDFALARAGTGANLYWVLVLGREQ